MSGGPVIAFGQQPCGFFPKRYLYAKIVTARRLREEIGGEVVFFLHDSDHDPRETRTILRHRKSGEALTFNFAFASKLQKKHSPMYRKRIEKGWAEMTARQLPAYVGSAGVDAFKSVAAATVGEFCLEVYRRLGLLDGIRVVRSSDPEVRRAACDVEDCFVDVQHEGELVRARVIDGVPCLHEGGERFSRLPAAKLEKELISPTRDTRLRWMQSVIRCTHYICGAGERAYLDVSETPEINFVSRDAIDRSDEAFVDFGDH